MFWTLLVLGLYYWVHKPFDAPLAGALGGVVLDLLTAGLFVALGGAIGRRALRAVDLAGWSVGELVAAQGIVGLAVLSLAIFAVGLVTLHPLAIALLLVAGLALTARDLLGWLRDLVGCVRAGLPPGGWPRFIALAVCALLGMALILSVLPPTQWDTLTYHLYGPERYVEHGRFYAVPYVHFLGFPQLVESLYTGQVALTGRLTASAPLHWAIGALMLLMTGAFTARRTGRTAGWVAAGTLVAAYTVWQEFYEAYVDLMLMALAIVMLAVVERWVDAVVDARSGGASRSTATRTLILLGALAGWAMSTKYTAIWAAISAGVLILWISRDDGWRTAIRRGAIYTAVAAIVLLPWLARNAIWYHNPVYPMFFPSAEMDAFRVEWYAAPGTGLVPTGRAWQVPVLPLTATIFGVDNGATYQADIGPLFAFLVPLLLVVWGRLDVAARALVRRVLIAVGVSVAAWMVSAAFGSFYNIQTRLVFFMLPWVAVLAGIAVDGLGRLPVKPLDLGFVLRAMIALVFVLALINTGRDFVTSGLHAYFSGASGYRSAYLEHVLGWTPVAFDEVNDLEPGTEVWFLWEPRGLYCDDERITCRVDSSLDAWVHARRTVEDGDPAAIAAAWQADGADALLVFESGRVYEEDGNDDYTAADWAAWQTFTQAYLDEVWRGGPQDEPAYILYRWRS
ncbi:hypothetical protein [Aggregatilinea lenta]|uniref:hypothetical protein n=1 Tax=Aggregatilinea lenta TaxID=913108 RepID=UPI0013C36BAD|nr:hypothetical protein [Aggregatilinea lenta]